MRRDIAVLLFTLGVATVSQADELPLTKERLSKWVETRKLISEEKEKWELEREVLSDRLDLVRSETDSLNTKIHETQAQITDADKKRADMVEENDSLKAASAVLVNRIHEVENMVISLLRTLPEPIRERIKPLSQRLPKTATTDLSLSERYQNVIGIVNELNKAANEINVVSEVRKLADGNTAEVQTLYIGFASAYYCTTKGDIAGYGRPGVDEWVWVEESSMAQKVSDAISILKNEKVAEYVSLPISVD